MGPVALTDEQEAFVASALSGRSVLVDACVGSGKTTAIQELCRRAQGRRILYLTYNKLLKLDAQARIAVPGVQVQNYHGFAWGELARNGIRTGVSDIMDNYLRAGIEPRPIDLLVLDEYQDINSDIAALLGWLRKCCPGMSVAAVGDMRQKLYDWTRMDVGNFISDYLGPGRDEMEFTSCFRLSQEHADRVGMAWGRRIVGLNPDMAARSVSPAEAYDVAAAADPRDLLVMGKKGGTEMMALLNGLERDLPMKFNKHTVWAKILDNDGGATQPGPECAVFTTFDGSKGMERPTCLVYDFTEAYWGQRLSPETANPDIIRNIFLVAASRGKRRIYFVRPQRGKLLKFSKMAQVEVPARLHKTVFDVSSMFDYKFSEDIQDAHALLDVEVLEPPGIEIQVPLADELIDLSPCVGIWAEASYFVGYDMDAAVARAQKLHPKASLRYMDVTGWPGERLILYVTALETGQARYVSQVRDGWIPEGAKNPVHARIAKHLPEDALCQVPCRTSLEATGYGRMDIDGIIDAFWDSMPWELKFTAALTEVHDLQLAGYLLATGTSQGRLLNVRTGELRRVRIRDRTAFAAQVARTVTKGLARGVRKRSPAESVRQFALAHPRAFREMEAAAASGGGPDGIVGYLDGRNLEPPAAPGEMMAFFRGAGGGYR